MVAQHDAIGEALLALVPLAVRQRDRAVSLTAASTLATLERTGPRRLTDLAVNEGVTQPSMTALVTQLQGQGLVERRADAGDRRVVLVALTRDGREYLRSTRRAGAVMFTTLIDKLTEAEAGLLHAALPAIRRLADLGAPGEGGATTRSGSA